MSEVPLYLSLSLSGGGGRASVGAEEASAPKSASPGPSPRVISHRLECSGSEAGSYLRRIDFCINSRLESNKEEEEKTRKVSGASTGSADAGLLEVRGQSGFWRKSDLCGWGWTSAVDLCKATPVILHGVVSPELGGWGWTFAVEGVGADFRWHTRGWSWRRSARCCRRCRYLLPPAPQQARI